MPSCSMALALAVARDGVNVADGGREGVVFLQNGGRLSCKGFALRA